MLLTGCPDRSMQGKKHHPYCNTLKESSILTHTAVPEDHGLSTAPSATPGAMGLGTFALELLSPAGAHRAPSTQSRSLGHKDKLFKQPQY